MIVVTEDFYGGEAGFNSILNDYYENAINDLPEKDRIKARRFIEEGLIVGERRVGMTEGVEKNRYDIDEDLLEILLDSRLVRAEITHLGRSYEVSHDTLIEPIVRSKKVRQEREEKEKRLAELRITRRRYFIASGIALTGIVLAATSTIFFIQANLAKKDAVNNLNQYINSQFQAAKTAYESAGEAASNSLAEENYSRATEEFNRAILVYETYENNTSNKEGYPTAEELTTDLQLSLQEIKTQLAQAEGKIDAEKQFNNFIERANAYIEGEDLDLLKAREEYTQAESLNIKQELLTILKRDLEAKIDNAFTKFINEGDRYFQQGQIGEYKACLAYKKAQKLRPKRITKKIRSRIQAGGC